MNQIQFDALPDSALLRERQLLCILPYSAPTLWRRVKSGDFPQPVRLPGCITCWRWSEVRQWLDEQANLRENAQ